MPKRFRLTRRFPVAMTEDGYRRLKRFSSDAGWMKARRCLFCLRTFDSVTNDENLPHVCGLFNAELDARKNDKHLGRML